MTQFAELLSEPTNYAIVQLPARNFPGVVFQGDSLFALTQQINEILELAAANDREELMYSLELLKKHTDEVLKRFELVCAQQNIQLPYSK